MRRSNFMFFRTRLRISLHGNVESTLWHNNVFRPLVINAQVEKLQKLFFVDHFLRSKVHFLYILSRLPQQVKSLSCDILNIVIIFCEQSLYDTPDRFLIRLIRAVLL